MVLFSDGVTEAQNGANDQFGEERLLETMKLHRTVTASEMVQAITKAVSDFAAGAPSADDLTLVVVRRAS